MKKFMSLITVLFLTLVLAGCSDTEQTNVTTEEQAEQSIVIELIDAYGVTTNTTITLDKDEDKTLLTLIEENIGLTYTESEYGKYITSIGGVTPKAGSYLSLSKNGEVLEVGIDEITYKSEDIITFEIIWWDSVLQEVDLAITKFVENYASTYVNETIIDYNVAAALYHLGIIDQFLTLDEVNTLYKDLTTDNSSELFRAIVAVKAAGGNPTDVLGNNLISQLVDVAETNQFSAPYSLMALNTDNYTQDTFTYEQIVVTLLSTTNPPLNAGLDLGGISLVALAPYLDQVEVKAAIDAFVSDVSEKQFANGGIADTTMWSSGENASSMSQVVMGLIAVGENPQGESFTKADGDLITCLLKYHQGDGSFKWKLDSESADLDFSTPQAFAALVMLQQYAENKVAIQLFDFSE